MHFHEWRLLSLDQNKFHRGLLSRDRLLINQYLRLEWFAPTSHYPNHWRANVMTPLSLNWIRDSGFMDSKPPSNSWRNSPMYYTDIIMGAIASQFTSPTIVYSTVYSDADQRKHERSASLAFVWGIHRGPVNSPHKWPVTRKMFPFDDVIMDWHLPCCQCMEELFSCFHHTEYPVNMP